MQTILVIEDETLIAIDLICALADADFQVVSAPTISAALQSIDNGPPDGAVLDAKLHGRWSEPVAKLLARLKVPYVIYSGTPWSEIEPWAASAASFVAKPRPTEDIVFAVQRALDPNN